MIKGNYKKPTINITLNDEKLNVFPIRLGTSQGCPLSPLRFDIIREILASPFRQEKGSDIIVFTYDMITKKQKLLFKYDLDYIGLLQGATEHNGILYIAQNTKTNNYNLEDYKGISVKAFNLNNNNKYIDTIQIDGPFEAEGMQTVEINGTTKIAMGFTATGTEKIIYFEPLIK